MKPNYTGGCRDLSRAPLLAGHRVIDYFVKSFTKRLFRREYGRIRLRGA
jgi:hypothetical protein